MSKTDASLIQQSNEDSITMIEDSEFKDDQLRDQNLESMQNIVKRPENCFISPFLNDADHQTRNISTITGQTELKETAQLGNESSRFDIINNMKKAKKIRGLQIIQKRLNNFLGENSNGWSKRKEDHP